jgi:hypothetical protein
MHAVFFGLRLLMIEAEQVQDTMNQQFGEMELEAHAAGFRLALAGFHRNDHIPQQVGGDVAKRALFHGKGQDIGRVGTTAIGLIEGGDAGIVDDQKRQFAVRTVQGV